MTLKERILETVGTRTLAPRELYAQLSGENAGVIDCAVAGLLRSGLLQKAFGAYQRPSAGSGSRAVAGGVAKVCAEQQTAPPQPVSPELRKRPCRRCRASKALSEFPTRNARICTSCAGPVVRPPRKQPITISPRLLACLEQRRANLAVEIEAALLDVEKGREELADLTQFLEWVKAGGS